MATPLEDLAHAYLEGALSHEEGRAFERELSSRAEVSQALVRVLALRDLLHSLPSDAPPLGLEERIAAALGLQKLPESETPSALVAQVRAALAGAGWSLRGAALAIEPAAAGVLQARWALGPLGAPRDQGTRKAPSRALWRRALALAWRTI